MFQALTQERIHEHIVDCRKRQKGKPGPDSEEELLKAAMARAREEDEFLQAVPEDETVKVRRSEVYFRRHP